MQKWLYVCICPCVSVSCCVCMNVIACVCVCMCMCERWCLKLFLFKNTPVVAFVAAAAVFGSSMSFYYNCFLLVYSLLSVYLFCVLLSLSFSLAFSFTFFSFFCNVLVVARREKKKTSHSQHQTSLRAPHFKFERTHKYIYIKKKASKKEPKKEKIIIHN